MGRLAVAGFMGAECDSVQRLLEEGREACLAFEERQGGEVLAVEIEKIEDEINEAGAAAIGGFVTISVRPCWGGRGNTLPPQRKRS